MEKTYYQPMGANKMAKPMAMIQLTMVIHVWIFDLYECISLLVTLNSVTGGAEPFPGRTLTTFNI